MRTRFFPAFLFLCCFLVTTSLAQKVDDPLTKKVDQLFATWDKPESPGAAIAVIKDGAVVYKRGYGSANLEYNIPITPQTVFHVASVSKQFTAFAIASLANQGKLTLDDDIRKHLPEVPDFGKKITIHELLTSSCAFLCCFDVLVCGGATAHCFRGGGRDRVGRRRWFVVHSSCLVMVTSGDSHGGH